MILSKMNIIMEVFYDQIILLILELKINYIIYIFNNDFNIISKIYFYLYCFYNIRNIYYKIMKLLSFIKN